MATVGYIRVSTSEQNIQRQVELLESECDTVFIDKVSGKNTNRPEYKRMMDYLRDGDLLVVESYDRLSRDLKDLIEIVEILKNKGVNFKSKKQDIDTSTVQGTLMFHMFGGLAQYERELIKQRQAEGIAIAKAEGKFKGRGQKKIDEQRFIECIYLVENKQMTIEQVCKEFKVSRNFWYTRYRLYKKTGSIKKQ